MVGMTHQKPTGPAPDDWKAAIGQVASVMGLLESTAVIRQTVGAYRDKLHNEENFSLEAAEEMAVAFHAFTVELFTMRVREGQQQKRGQKP